MGATRNIGAEILDAVREIKNGGGTRHNFIRIIDYKPEYAPYFDRCNREWLEDGPGVEPIDEALFANPEGLIISPGGYIGFAVMNGEVIGTAALIRQDDSTFELAKMGVLKSARGHGAGEMLARHCISKAREMGAEKVVLMSNTVLEPAIKLYEKLGFRVTDVGSHPKYKRCNIQMELML